MFDRIAVMGAGAQGTILGAHIAQARQVDLIDTNRAHIDALRERGARLVGDMDLTVPVRAVHADEMEGKYDLFIYLAKQTANKAAIPRMLEFSHENTCLCSPQNGIPERDLARYWDAGRLFGAPAGWGGIYVEPGVVSVHAQPMPREFFLGAYDGRLTPELLECKKILECLCPVEVTGNLMGVRWGKLTINATFSGMSTVTGLTFGDLAFDDRAVRCVARIGRECVAVARACGVKVEKMGSLLDLESMYTYESREEEDALVGFTRSYRKGSKGRASMLNDLEAGITVVEIDAINGVVCEEGRAHGIPTPYNDAVVRVVRRLCAGESRLGYHNLDEFNELLSL